MPHITQLKRPTCCTDAGLDFVTVGDFAFYDHVLETSALLGVVPARFAATGDDIDLDTLFRMARGRAPCGCDAAAQEMTKWFDTNYHYLVPELTRDQEISLRSSRLFDQVEEARAQGHQVKAVLLGPLTWLWLGKCHGEAFDRLELLPRLLAVYGQIFDRLAALGVERAADGQLTALIEIAGRLIVEIVEHGPKKSSNTRLSPRTATRAQKRA